MASVTSFAIDSQVRRGGRPNLVLQWKFIFTAKSVIHRSNIYIHWRTDIKDVSRRLGMVCVTSFTIDSQVRRGGRPNLVLQWKLIFTVKSVIH